MPASAQMIDRSKKTPTGDAAAPPDDSKPAAAADDDILAPAKGTGTDDKKPEPAPSTKTIKVGLVPLVAVGDASKPLADEVTAALLKELGGGAVFDTVSLAVDAGATANSAQDLAASQAQTDATALLEKGKAFTDKLQFGKAKASYEQALVKLSTAAPVLADAALLFDAHVGLAEVAARQGQDEQANAELMLASVLIPERELDAKRFPAQFVRSQQKARVEAMAQPRGVVFVDQSGAGSAVQIDGRETALCPLKLLDVPVGTHLVRVLREGLPSYGTVITVAPGSEQTVSPGFLSVDGSSYADVLAQNRFDANALAQVQKALAAAGLKGAFVGVASKADGAVPVQLLYVDASGSSKLPATTFQDGLLDVSIESLKVRERTEELVNAAKPAGAKGDIAELLAGAKAGAALHTAEVKLRYEFKAVQAERRSRVTGAEAEDETRSVVSAGKTGKRQRMDDDADPYAETKQTQTVIDEDATGITQQPWFLPVVIAGGVGAAVIVGGATVLGLVAFKVLPDPRPANQAEVHVTVPK